MLSCFATDLKTFLTIIQWVIITIVEKKNLFDLQVYCRLLSIYSKNTIILRHL